MQAMKQNVKWIKQMLKMYTIWHNFYRVEEMNMSILYIKNIYAIKLYILKSEGTVYHGYSCIGKDGEWDGKPRG